MRPETKKALLEAGANAIESMAAKVANESYARLVGALSQCSFLPGTWDKRFVGRMAREARPGAHFSELQRIQLLRLAQKYRRQLPTEIVTLAQGIAAVRAGEDAPRPTIRIIR